MFENVPVCRTRSVVPAVCLVVGAFAAPAMAAPPPIEPARPRMRFHSEVQAAGYTHVAPSVSSAPSGAAGPLVPASPLADAVPSAKSNSLGVGLGRLRKIDQQIPIWSLGLGVVLGDRAMVGVRTGVTAQWERDPEADISTRGSGGKLVPYFQYMFRQDGIARPYAEARFGMAGSKSVVRTRGANGATTKVNTVGPVAGVGGGVHLFFVPTISLTLGLDLDYHASFAKFTVRTDEQKTTSDWEKVSDLLDLGVTAGLSIWF